MRTFVFVLLMATAAHRGESAPPVLQSLAIDPERVTIEEGRSAVFVAIGTSSSGVRRIIADHVRWSSSDSKVATVAADGTVQGVAHGRVTIRAAVGRIGASATLIVLPRLTSVRVDPSSETLAPGESYAFTVRGRYSDGRRALLTDRAIWSIEGDGAATVSAAGRAFAVKNGTATIVATVHGLRATARLLVADRERASVQTERAEPPAEVPPRPPVPVLQGVIVEPAAGTLRENETQRLTAWGRYSDGTERDITREAVWASTDVRVAIVGDDGTVLGVRFGTATVAATLQTWSGVAALTVTPVVARIAIRPGEPMSIRHRAEAHLDVIAILTDGSVDDITDRATWTSSDEAVVFIRDGSLQGVAPGTATITAAFDAFRASVPVVVEPVVESISIHPSLSSLAAAQVRQLTAIARLSDGGTRDVTFAATWSCDSPAVRVSPTGLVTATGEGSAVVKVRYDSVEAEAKVDVVVDGVGVH